jgi:23S rRNA (cytosine1962-C5)-methyltransferase
MKPHKPQPVSNQKAPRAHKPKAPFEPVDEKPTLGQGPDDRKLKRNVYSEGKGAGSDRTKPKSPARSHGVLINRRAADRLRNRHLWVYASDIESIDLPEAASDSPPALLPVADSRGLLLGTALYSPSSQIALRLVSREAIDEKAWLELLASRLRRAILRRKPLLDGQTDACRLCFSEADELPGLVVDKYGNLVILQLLAKGLDSAAVRGTCVRVLREELGPQAILERPDPRMRELEGLGAPSLEPLFVAEGARTEDTAEIGRTQFRLNGLVFHFDANAGQKTGAFLDQRDNYAATRQWAQRLGANGRALDVCCYQGGFALHLAQVCSQVTGVDASRASLEVAERNLAANRDQISAAVDWVDGDAFQILRDWSEAGETYDAIVLDPPAFAKTKRAVEGAMRGYKELNLRALKMLRPGGLLVTCSCSHHVSGADLEAIAASAAVDAGRRVRLLERRGAALDHPVVLNLPETEYLKCLVLEVE